jgi:hypothetical protein
MRSGGFAIGLMPRVGLKADASGVTWRRNGLALPGDAASDRASVDVDFRDDALYIAFVREQGVRADVGREDDVGCGKLRERQ